MTQPGVCADWTPVGPFPLAPGAASATSPALHRRWPLGTHITVFADGQGTDSLGCPVPTTGEHQAGALDVINPATGLSTSAARRRSSPRAPSWTVTVRETNSGTDPLSNVSG